MPGNWHSYRGTVFSLFKNMVYPLFSPLTQVGVSIIYGKKKISLNILALYKDGLRRRAIARCLEKAPDIFAF
ncbi:hypothetical protein DO021_06485 [Desulfobacter hydrogenophilus]|uniref:Uncharacterized protein n=1 Tax=Desulfobacter hydrogenophilus TaxID=2291 RepID=A0A328FHA7_9BACT|nr:hypothetical protein DO021_06485 [Desulfobacter hydrogenophilus]